jgi:ACS family tartrate transporter-like MFS transporter
MPSADAAPVLAKARRRLIPFLFLLYIVAYLDRINVGFAALQMNQALGFSSTTYGLGAGIFFFSYVLFEIPSNVILARVGARLWIARIMVTWGLVSSGMMFVRTAPGFYALRFLLGLAEAGFFPGIIFYFTKWFPPRERARTIATFMTATLTAGVIGAPISGALLTVDALGLAGWQWLFLLEGIPAIVLGVVVLFVLPDGPETARWLTDEERAAVRDALREPARGDSPTVGRALANGRVWLVSIAHFLLIPVALYGIGFWMPQILKTASGAGDFAVGLLTAMPYACGAVAMVIAGRHSDRTGERRWHVAIAAAVCALGLTLSALGVGPLWAVVTLSLAMIGLAGVFGPFWALASVSIRGAGAAAAIALINSVGNVGGFVGPYLLGAINDATHSFAMGLYAIAAMLVLGGALVLGVRDVRSG